MKISVKIGFSETVETRPGIWKTQIIEHIYFGDLTRNNRRLEGSSQINNDVNISNQLSIVANPYANEHFYMIRYVEFMGAKWRVTDVDASQPPRLILSFGGLYNEE